jgi:hypothetical protein
MLRLTGRAIDRPSRGQGVKFVRGLRAALVKLSSAPTKLTPFRRINSPQASARPMKFQRVATTVHCVDDEIIGDCAAWIETIPDGRYCLRDLMENLCALNGRSLARQSQFI